MTFTGNFSAVVVALATVITPSTSFMIRAPAPVSTRLYLDDWVADLIDKELYRQGHKKDFEAEWMEKNRAAVFSKIETDFGPIGDPDETDFRMHNKDKKMAENDPERYCADRCIATGNCDIFEDFYELGPEDVIKFCTECVLSEEEEECDLPKGFYDRPMP